MLAHAFTRKEPFLDHVLASSLAATLRSIAERDLRPHFPESCPTAIRDLAADCWARNPAKRPTMNQIQDALVKAVREVSADIQSADTVLHEQQLQREFLAALSSDLANAADAPTIALQAAEAMAQMLSGVGAVAVVSLDFLEGSVEDKHLQRNPGCGPAPAAALWLGLALSFIICQQLSCCSCAEGASHVSQTSDRSVACDRVSLTSCASLVPSPGAQPVSARSTPSALLS